jgi:hypothetical protein
MRLFRSLSDPEILLGLLAMLFVSACAPAPAEPAYAQDAPAGEGQ